MTNKNNQIDFVKFFLSICVFLFHARSFADKHTYIREISNKFGWFSVHFFFVISGLFMAVHYSKVKDKSTDNCGKESIQYVLKKFRSIAPLYFSSFLVCFTARLIYEISDRRDKDILTVTVEFILKSVPEMFSVHMSGVRPVGIDNVTWYLSAMLLAMIPLYYIMRKNPDFFFFILSPMLSLGLFGAFYRSDEPLINQNKMIFIFTGGFLRAVCGICFGALSYQIAEIIRKKTDSKRKRIYITLTEIFLTLIFLYVWFEPTLNAKVLFPTALLFPLLLAIMYSEMSYISKLFRSGVFKYCGTLSFRIYLNHYIGRIIIENSDSLKKSDTLEKYLFMLVSMIISMMICRIIIFLQKKYSSYILTGKDGEHFGRQQNN